MGSDNSIVARSFVMAPLVEPSWNVAVELEAVPCLAWRVEEVRAQSGLAPNFGGTWTLDWEEAI